MLRFYSPILLLQAYCLWHAYSKGADQKWYYLILFIPLIGCILYLYDSHYSRENVEDISEGISGFVNRDYHIQKLEKEQQFSDTLSNRIRLAEAYLDKGRHEKAIAMLESCLSDFSSGEKDIHMLLVRAYYQNEAFDKAVRYGETLEGETDFEDSMTKVAYAWSLQKSGRPEKAEQAFKEMDGSYCNFPHRIQYARYMNEEGRKEDALKKLEELLDEYDHMDRMEKRSKRPFYNEINSLWREFKGR